jgi:hypothetical protein
MNKMTSTMICLFQSGLYLDAMLTNIINTMKNDTSAKITSMVMLSLMNGTWVLRIFNPYSSSSEAILKYVYVKKNMSAVLNG